MTTIVVLAKAPVPGRVKTRLCPPCTPEEAARLAEAALHDTLVAASACGCDERVLVLDGSPGPWLPPGWRLVAQVPGNLNRRLAGAFRTCAAPAVLVGMDTPQLDPGVLDRAFVALTSPVSDAVLGPARDGGYWAIGFARRVRGAFRGVPMSTSHTCVAQHARLRALGLRTRLLPTLRDVDHFDDAPAVARDIPTSQFAAAVASVAALDVR